MTTQLCRQPYRRPKDQGVLTCQYIADHPTHRHSFFAIQEQDKVDALAEEQRRTANTPEKGLIENIELGMHDSILEAILNAAHNRKRALRGVRGFPRMERRGA